MKAKKLMGLIAFASAFVSLSAFASTTNGWFGVTVDGKAVTPVNTVNISTNGVGVVENDAIKLTDVAQKDALVFTPDASFSETNRNDGIYVIRASVALTPCSTNDFSDANVGEAKAGIVVGIDENDNTNYYGYASGGFSSEATDYKWIPLSDATVVDPGVETTFAIVLNYRDSKVNFMIRESEEDKWFGPYLMSNDGGASAALANIKAWGMGSISCVTGEFEVAEAAYGGKKYGSVAEAMSAAPTAEYNNIVVYDETGAAEEQELQDNGLMPWQNKAMGVESDEQVGLAKASTKQNTGKITLAANLNKKEDGVVVKFDVYCGDEKVNEDPYDEDNIQIPMGSVGSATYRIVPVVQTTK